MKVTFQGFWHGPDLTPMHWSCLRSFIQRGHGFHLFAYEPLAVPEGVSVEDASAILPAETLFAFQNDWTGDADYAPFADLFRLKLLHDRGGWWCDVDTYCLADEFPDATYAWALERPTDLGDLIGNGQLRLPPGEPVLDRLFREGLEKAGSIDKREAFGGAMLSKHLTQLGQDRAVYGTRDTFYPLGWIDSFVLWLPECLDIVRRRTENAVFLPVYQSMSAYIGLDFAVLPPTGSFLHEAYADTLAEAPTGRRYSADDVRNIIGRWFAEQGDWAIDELVLSADPSVVSTLGFLPLANAVTIK